MWFNLSGTRHTRRPSSGVPRLSHPVAAIQWSADRSAIRIVDQTRLPATWIERDLVTVPDAIDAIRTLAVRGAPAIGICGAMALALHAQRHRDEAPELFRGSIATAAEELSRARPTAVNLAWAVGRVARVADGQMEPRAAADAMMHEAARILDEDRAMCRAIGEHGAGLLKSGMRVLTHCNAGALATGGIGTALAPLYVAQERGIHVEVYADETRPLFQGARLTAWELQRGGIPVTVLADSMAAALMGQGGIDLVLVGADRIAANGDVANKIGTYGLAVAAHHHHIPFHVAAPSSTFDPATPRGAHIVIEQRSRDEVARPWGHEIVPDEVPVLNPAFDVTPATLITSIITEHGLHRPGELRHHLHAPSI